MAWEAAHLSNISGRRAPGDDSGRHALFRVAYDRAVDLRQSAAGSDPQDIDERDERRIQIDASGWRISVRFPPLGAVPEVHLLARRLNVRLRA